MWHILKNFKKNNGHAIKLVRNCDLMAHWNNILVHIWISIEAADGDGELAVELIRSAEYHLQGIHKLPQDKFNILTECLHDDLPDLSSGRPRAYLDPVKHSLQVKVLHDMLNDLVFLNNVRNCAPRETTSTLESFHSLIVLIYIPKNHYFDKETIATLMKLAILHHNSHRRQILDSIANGTTLPVRMKFSKAQGRMRSVVQHPKPTMTWKVTIKDQVLQHYKAHKDYQRTNRRLGRPMKNQQDEVDNDADAEDDDGEGDGDDSLDVGDVSDDSETEHVGEELAPHLNGADDDGETVSLNDVSSPSDSTSTSTNTTAVFASASPKPRIGPLGPRSFAKIYRELGADADKYEYYDGYCAHPFHQR